MKLARYWTRCQGEARDLEGRLVQVVSRGWSDDSLENARRVAGERAQRLAQRIATNPGARKEYDYGDAPLPEPVICDFRASGTAAVVTRNSYGALVLNADDLMFADVDAGDAGQHPSPGGLVSEVAGAGTLAGVISGLFSLFGGRSEPPSPPPSPMKPQSPALDRIRQVAERHGFSVRVYRTAAGYRAMVTDRQIPGGGDEAEAVLNEFGSDPLYMRLCRTQQSYRARLTPKPWRANARKPPAKFPIESATQQAAFARWEAEYNQRIASFATCRFVASFGGGRIHAPFRELLDYHDRETRAASDLPLA